MAGNSRKSNNSRGRASTVEVDAIQKFGELVAVPLGLGEVAREDSVTVLNQILADTLTLRDLYRKSHWHVTGPTFYQLHELFEAHYKEQDELADVIAERVQLLGGVALAMGDHVAEHSHIKGTPADRESVAGSLQRLVAAHEHIIGEVRENTERLAEQGDLGSDDLLVSQVLRTNEKQVWFVSQHLNDTPLVRE